MDGSNSSAVKTNQAREVCQNLIKNDIPNRNGPLINIQDEFLLISSYANGKTNDTSLIIDTLKSILLYYTDLQIQKDFDIFLHNKKICESLISLISNREEIPIIRIYIIKIIYLFISLNKDISIQLAELQLFDSFKQILEEDQVITDIYVFISKILFQMLTYQDDLIIELLAKSSLVPSIIDKLSKYTTISLSDQENLYIIDHSIAQCKDFKFNMEDLNEKYPSTIISIENKQKLEEQSFIEFFVFEFFNFYYYLKGNIDDEINDYLLTTMATLISEQNQKFLTQTISHTLTKMIMASYDNLIKSFNLNLPYLLNEQLGVDKNEYEMEWPYILEFDIAVLKCVQDEFFKDIKQEIVEKIYEYANPQLLYSLIDYTIKTSENKENDYQQTFIKHVFNCYSNLFNSFSSIIVEDDDITQESNLSLQQFYELADIFEYHKNFSNFLLNEFVHFIFTAFNTQDIFGSHLDVIDEVFSKYKVDIFHVLDSGVIFLEKLMLIVFIKLIIIISEEEYQSEIITSILNSDELNDFAQKCLTDDNDETDDELKELSGIFIEKTSNFFK